MSLIQSYELTHILLVSLSASMACLAFYLSRISCGLTVSACVKIVGPSSLIFLGFSLLFG